MNKNIILAGVGGQGILTIASIIDLAAIQSGLHIKQAEVHGMSQRGGEVQSHLRISSTIIHSDLIPLGQADLIISVEPLEALRYVPFLKKDGIIISATEPFVNINNYPNIDEVLHELQKFNCKLIAAAEIAQQLGNAKAYNLVLLGTAAPYIGIEKSVIENAIRTLFAAKGEIVISSNIEAFNKGLELL
ncbi:MAG: indolepyruvate oxidoreductase subunit beta [Bacteroidales bacterium]|jgi:indolepyruvate ferredoxin oxidoreductase beta subunit|nr:indolepyruvate oxidoreductase subunit beta [Bacteroidales bacterium]